MPRVEAQQAVVKFLPRFHHAARLGSPYSAYSTGNNDGVGGWADKASKRTFRLGIFVICVCRAATISQRLRKCVGNHAREEPQALLQANLQRIVVGIDVAERHAKIRVSQVRTNLVLS